MEEMRYTISDAAKLVNVESHVLRYWEDELDLVIPRNEMGHRYYTEKEIQVFKRIRALKDKGFQLKAIKSVLETIGEETGDDTNIITLEQVRPKYADEPSEENTAEKEIMKAPVTAEKTEDVPAVSASEKMSHFKYIMDSIVAHALQENNLTLEEEITEQVAERVLREMDEMMKARENRDEARFKRLDETIRNHQKGYREAAATKLPPYTPTKMNKRKRFRWFRH